MPGDLELLEQEKREAAAEIAVRAGILHRCDAHETLLCDGTDDYSSAYKLGNVLISRKDPAVAIFEGDRREMTDTIQAVIAETGDECYACRKVEDDY